MRKDALIEDTRNMLISKSRNAGTYKNTTFGKNRFERKRLSKISNSVKEYNKIDMNELFKHDSLIVKVPVIGETSNYEVSIKMDGVITELAKNIKNNKNVFEFKTVLQALTKVFNTANIYVNCNCEDYKYRFRHWNIINNVSTEGTDDDPGPGKGIANPDDDKGKGCKHVLLVLDNNDWMMKVASVLDNYIHFMEEHNTKPFLNLIFPKLYGTIADDMAGAGLVSEDDAKKFLNNSKGLLDAISKYDKTKDVPKKEEEE